MFIFQLCLNFSLCGIPFPSLTFRLRVYVSRSAVCILLNRQYIHRSYFSFHLASLLFGAFGSFIFKVFFFFFFFLPFLGPLPWHMEAPRLGVYQSCSRWPTPEPQLRRIQAASATHTTAHGNARFPNPLSKARDRTRNP